MDLHARLADPRRYRDQIERLHQKYLFSRRMYELRQGDVSFASVYRNRRRVSRLLARAVASGSYRPEPAQIRTIVADGKERRVFAYSLTDVLVHRVVAAALEEALAPRLSDRLFSYRPGVSWLTPVSQLAKHVREHRRARPNPLDRGLYVLRCDVDAYTDSIPVGPGSPVWGMVRELLIPHDRLRSSDRELLETVIRPTFRIDGGVATLIRGVATGQTISCVLFNLYLADVDHDLAGVPGGYYARYSDDLVFAHEDPDAVREAERVLRGRLAERGLRANEEKTQVLYLTGAGRPSAAWPDARGTTRIPFLGTHVAADGRVSLNRKKLRGLLRDLESRARRTAEASDTRDPDHLGPLVASVLNRALRSAPGPAQERSSALLHRAITDRGQLAEVDYRIARIVLAAATGDRDVRAFRRIPYRRIREDWGLRSMVRARNEWASWRS